MALYVGMDVHRKRSQVAILDHRGEELLNRNVINDPAALLPILGKLPSGTPVAFEATYGWAWLVDLLSELELDPHLAHPKNCHLTCSGAWNNWPGRGRTTPAAHAANPSR